jgi:ABC-type phosphate transport system substrate-binding protein
MLLGMVLMHGLASACASDSMPVTVIAHARAPAASLSLAQARALFSMRMTQWPDGSPVRVFVLAPTQAPHVAFCKQVLDLYPYQLRQSWDRLVYSGLGQAPVEVESETEMIRRVASTPGAVGYVTRSPVDASVKILRVE